MRGLPKACYVDPEFFAAERERVLLPSWQLVCHVADLPAPGTAIRCDFLGRSALLLRGPDGTVRGFSNACRHRGSRLIEGDAATGLAFCVDGRVRCPTHGWEYDARGALVGVPRETQYPGLDRALLGLRPIAVETGLGFVFAAFEPASSALANRLQDCAAELEPYRLPSLRRLGEPLLRRCRANWKLVCEQAVDSHRASPAQPTPRPAVESRHAYARHGELLRIAGEIDGDDPGAWSMRAYAQWLPEQLQLPPARRRLWARYLFWPNLLLDVCPDQVIAQQILPLGPADTLVRETTYGVTDGSHEIKLARYLNRRARRRFATTDRRVAERMQSGIECGDGGPGPLAGDDQGVRWFVGRVRAAMPEAGR
ncbi:MAG TPA: aromatic ring-hydroxylating dioxygenase subunit alpha [Burkholderiales bacterium]|nr:aromatic ring-hydroxylating dioxygenase subunit alpha [Burkholderiales bacterium]